MSFDCSDHLGGDQSSVDPAAHLAAFQCEVALWEEIGEKIGPAAWLGDRRPIGDDRLRRLAELQRQFLSVIQSLRGVESVMHDAAIIAKELDRVCADSEVQTEKRSEQRVGRYRLMNAQLESTLPLIRQCGNHAARILNEAATIYAQAAAEGVNREQRQDN